MSITKYTVKCCLDKKLGHFVHVIFSHGHGLHGHNLARHTDEGMEIHGWTFEPEDIDLKLYPVINTNNLMPLVDWNEMDWVIIKN
jgi:hypothetical protein